MKDIQQLIKKNSQEGRYEDIFPKTFIDAVKDRGSGNNLTEILSGFNMYFLSYNGSREQTRLQVPTSIRKTGLWITYVLYDKTVVTEWYAGEAIDDNSWKNLSNWRVGTNMLVGDISISSDGYWIINGVITNTKAQGEQGITPILRVGSNNHLQVSYTNGSSWLDISDNIAAWFRWKDNRIQISRDSQLTWENLSDKFLDNLRIQDYVETVDKLPTNASLGSIYMVGPDSKGKYRLHVNSSTGWIDNGEFAGLSVGVVQKLGQSITEVPSQKLLSDELENIYNSVQVITEEEYNKLEIKNPNIFYFTYEKD